MSLVRNDDGHRLVSVLRSVNANIGNEGTAFVDRFKSFEGDVLEPKANIQSPSQATDAHNSPLQIEV